MRSVVFSLRLTLAVACAGPIAAAIHSEKPRGGQRKGDLRGRGVRPSTDLGDVVVE
jgi:hypothetical protein